MTIQQFIGKPATRWQRTYLLKKPWMKHLTWARSRSKKLKRECTLTAAEAEELWEVCDADKLAHPSIDRVDPSKGYTFGNCRFIEKSENSRLGNLGRTTSEKQRQASRKNITKWAAAPERKGAKRGPYKKRV